MQQEAMAEEVDLEGAAMVVALVALVVLVVLD